MDLFVLMGQRTESYPGEYAPEALAVIDEVGDEDNPDYMRDELKKAKDSGDFENTVVIKVTVSGGEVMKLLRPMTAALVGTVAAA